MDLTSNQVVKTLALALAVAAVASCADEDNGAEQVDHDASVDDGSVSGGSNDDVEQGEPNQGSSRPGEGTSEVEEGGPDVSGDLEPTSPGEADMDDANADDANADDETGPTNGELPPEAGSAVPPRPEAGRIDAVGRAEAGPTEDSNVPTEGGSDAPQIQWSETDDRVGSRRIELATLEVPVDYQRPAGEKLELALARLRTNSAERRGVMLFNPGGPGATLIWDAAYLLTQLSLVFENFDIVLMDNRGMGQSSPMRCYEAADEVIAEVDDSIGAQVADGAAYMANLLAACDDRFGERMKFFNSENVARDMERLRLGLGEEQLNFWGVSYGTMQGALYAAMFPDAVRGWVLDSPVVRFGDADPNMIDLFIEGSEQYELQLDRFVSRCDLSEACGVSGEVEGGTGAALDVLQESLDGGVTYEGIELPRVMLAAFLETALRYGDWALIDLALSEALNDDWYTMLQVVFGESGEDEQDSKNSEFANVIINRVDFGCPANFTTEDAVTVATNVAERFPRLGQWSAIRAGLCVGWDLERSELPIIPSQIEAPPIAVMGALHDPATPYSNAVSLVEQLDNGSLLLTAEIEGHGVGVANDCALDALISVIDSGEANGLPESCGNLTPQGARVSASSREAARRLSGWLDERSGGFVR